MSHTNSKTWIAPGVRETEAYQVTINSVKRHFPKSAVAHWNVSTWITHKVAMADAKLRVGQRRLAAKEAEAGLAMEPGYPTLHKAMDDKELSAGQTAVLCMHSIWCNKNFDAQWRIIAPWPGMAELKWEGDDRARTKVGRFLPLPREPSPDNLPWNQRMRLRQSMWDENWKIPTEEDVLYPMWQLSEETELDKHYLVNQDLLDALDPDKII
ncbi:uncharacterized protein K452DRAFT_309029 [Aplosporella prunicola CBS 121167]|uniref:Uncharacterized protein n=1 Tax=Aplosporella prunicola CBS 121167 TaxID=1176127 RepID=A0A6A6BAX0_9PEZI|nr:uncharacterized protein K452DRAFT_309029 [Aplosporella prunicola CBS 121167]KAF2141240.1 hypothetical protein K452DRAFT_309029 [Aplosporella prunicola CBS 121167]